MKVKISKISIVSTTILALLIIASCKTRKSSSIPVTETNTVKKADKVPQKPAYVLGSLPYQATKPMINDLIHTKLKVSFDWQKQYLFGEAELTFTPYFFPQNQLILDAKGFDIHELVLLKGNERIALNYDYKDSLQLVIDLDKTYLKGEKYIIGINYTAKPNELKIKTASQAISDDKGLYFINPLGEDSTKPRQIWTQGETEASSCWFPTIDQPNEKTTQEIAITVDDNFVTLSNGTLDAQMHNVGGTRTDFWSQDKPHAPYLFMMAIGEFAVVYDKWLAPKTGEEIEINYYVEKDFEPYAKKIFGNTPEMIGFFSKKLGYEFPWDKYSQIVVRDYVSGAMENTSASVFMGGLQLTDRELLDKNWDYIIAHELFHHWFGDLVTCESWGNLALNESFANYSEYLWYEYKFGKDYADAHRQEELSDYLAESEKKQVPIIRSNYVHRMDMFDNHSYSKGGLVLHMLRRQIGDEAFFQSLRHYLHKNQFTDAEIDELRLAFEETTGLDFKLFLNPGHPDLLVEKAFEGGKLKIDITQRQDSLYTPLYFIPTEIEYSIDGVLKRKKIEIQGYKTTIEIELEKEPEYVMLDPDQVLLAEIEETNLYSENISIYNTSSSYQAKYNALDQLVMDFANTNYALRSPEEVTKAGLSITKLDSINTLVLSTIFNALNDKSEHIKLQNLEVLSGYDAKMENQLRRKYQELIEKDSASSVRAKSISNLSALINKATASESEKKTIAKSLSDPSYQVLGEALLAGISLEVEGAEEMIAKYVDSDKSNIIKAIGKYYVLKGEQDKDQWVINAFNKTEASDLMSLIDMFVEISRMSNQVSQQNLINFFYSNGIEGKDIYTRYTSYRVLHALDKIEGVRDLRQEIIRKEPSAMLLGVYKNWESAFK
jgi:aminopeptidase N